MPGKVHEPPGIFVLKGLSRVAGYDSLVIDNQRTIPSQCRNSQFYI